MATDGVGASGMNSEAAWPRFERRRVRKWLIIGVLVLAVLAIEGVSAARVAATAHASPTVDQQLAAAQQAVTFPIRLPAWLPPGVTLQSVMSDHCPDFLCGASNSHVHLNYSSASGISYALDEGTGPMNYSFETQGSDGKPYKMDEMISTVRINGTTAELDIYSGTLGATTPIEEAVLSWSQGSVYYGLVANAAPGLTVAPGDIARIAESM